VKELLPKDSTSMKKSSSYLASSTFSQKLSKPEISGILKKLTKI